MNTQTALQLNGTYTDPVLEKYVAEKHKEYLAHARYLGVTTAIQNTLQPNTPLRVICEPIQMNYNELLAHCHRHNEGILSIAQGKLQIEALEAENESRLKEIEQGQAKLDIEKYNTGKITMPSVPYRQFIMALVIGALILLTDSYFFGNAFQSTGAGFGIAILLGLGISLSIAVIAALATVQAEKTENKKVRLLTLLGFAALVGFSIYVLCEMRSKFYQSQSGQDMGAGKLALLTLLAYVAFHLLYRHLINPAFQRMKERREAKDKLSRLNKMEKKLNALKQAYTDNLKRIDEVKQFRLAVLAYSKSLEINVTRMYRQAVAIFKQSFTEQSGYIHPCFAEEPADLNGFYDGINITTTVTHEKAE